MHLPGVTSVRPCWDYGLLYTRSVHTRKVIRRVVSCLLLGVLASIGVAEATGWWSRLPVRSADERRSAWALEDHLTAFVTARSALGKESFLWAVVDWRYSESVPSVGVPDEVPRWCGVWNGDQRQEFIRIWNAHGDHGHQKCSRVDVGLGCPSTCVCELSFYSKLSAAANRRHTDGGWDSSVESNEDSLGGQRVLAWIPDWPGIAADSLFWGAIVGCAWRGTEILRASLRRRRGLCPNCGYDVASLPPGSVCPECGGVCG